MERKPVVLAVDDKPANLLAIEAVLGSEYDVLRANSGGEAIDLLQYRRDIDLVLMDVHMPGMDGFETASRIKLIESASDLPIVFITAEYREDFHVRKGYAVGGIDYFSKPFDPDVLKMKVGIYAGYRQRFAALKEREQQFQKSEKLRAAARKVSVVLEAQPLGVIISDLEGRACQTNEAVSRILKAAGLMESDAYGEILAWWDAGGRKLKEAGGPLSRALHGGQGSRNERITIQGLDGSEKTILCSASPLSSVDGQIVGAVLIIQDAADPQKVQDDLQERIVKLLSLGVELEKTQG